MAGETVFDKRTAVSTLLDILMIFSRNDLKSELLKELDKHASFLKQIASRQSVDTEKLNTLLNELADVSKKLYEINGKIGINVMESDLFQSISQRNAIPGGTCSFDLPAFHYWLEQNNNIQQSELTEWIKPFMSIHTAISLILDFIRQNGIPTEEAAEAGFFQLSLNKSQPFQLLRVAINSSLPCFAEISGGKHRFTIRFMSPSSDNHRPAQINQQVPFRLTRCVF